MFQCTVHIKNNLTNNGASIENLLDSSNIRKLKPSDDSFPFLGVGVFADLLHTDLHAGQC
jgi:hypothetical protein